jgi:hypothetical protein
MLKHSKLMLLCFCFWTESLWATQLLYFGFSYMNTPPVDKEMVVFEHSERKDGTALVVSRHPSDTTPYLMNMFRVVLQSDTGTIYETNNIVYDLVALTNINGEQQLVLNNPRIARDIYEKMLLAAKTIPGFKLRLLMEGSSGGSYWINISLAKFLSLLPIEGNQKSQLYLNRALGFCRSLLTTQSGE